MKKFWVQQSARNGVQAKTVEKTAETAEEAIMDAFGCMVTPCGENAIGGEYITETKGERGFKYWKAKEGP